MEFDFVIIDEETQLNIYIDDILALQHSCDITLPEDSWYIPSDKEEFYDYINNQNGIIIVAVNNYRVAGVISAGLDNNHYNQAKNGGAELPSKKYLYLSLVCVEHMFRGNGLQYKLMDRVISLARSMGYKGCWCRVHPGNIYSVCNIEKAGLKHISDYTTEEGWPRRIYACKV